MRFNTKGGADRQCSHPPSLMDTCNDDSVIQIKYQVRKGQAPCIRCKIPEKYLKTQVSGYQADIIRQKYAKNQKILPVLSNIHSSRPVLMLRVVKV